MSRGTAAAQEVRELQLIIVALRADLDRANEHNRNLMAEVNQQSKVIAELNDAVKWLRAELEHKAQQAVTTLGGNPSASKSQGAQSDCVSFARGGTVGLDMQNAKSGSCGHFGVCRC